MAVFPQLSASALRVLGALIEKEITTPEAYPLSVNALVAASNQRSSRDPVMELTEDDVRTALDVLEANELVSTTRDSRVPRFEHRIRTVLTLRRDETAVLCLLLLRGPQTPGELRGRAERLFTFDDLAAVQATLDRLAGREQPLVATLPRQPGSREARSMHLMGDARVPVAPVARAAEADPSSQGELAELRRQVESLTERVAALEAKLEAVLG